MTLHAISLPVSLLLLSHLSQSNICLACPSISGFPGEWMTVRYPARRVSVTRSLRVCRTMAGISAYHPFRSHALLSLSLSAAGAKAGHFLSKSITLTARWEGITFCLTSPVSFRFKDVSRSCKQPSHFLFTSSVRSLRHHSSPFRLIELIVRDMILG